jgi:hypothetical protein
LLQRFRTRRELRFKASAPNSTRRKIDPWQAKTSSSGSERRASVRFWAARIHIENGIRGFGGGL